MSPRAGHAIRIVGALLLAAAVVAGLLGRGSVAPDVVSGWLGQAGAAGPVWFVALYAVATVLCLPGALAYTWLGHAGREALAGNEGALQASSIALALVACAAFLPRLLRRLREPAMLDINALKAELDAGADLLLIDVRSVIDFDGEQGHIAGATNLPLEEIPARLDELAGERARPIRLVCRTDRRSAQAARLLAAAGHHDVRVVAGGMTAWRSRGWPLAPSRQG